MPYLDYGRRPDPWSAQDRHYFCLISRALMHAKILPPWLSAVVKLSPDGESGKSRTLSRALIVGCGGGKFLPWLSLRRSGAPLVCSLLSDRFWRILLQKSKIERLRKSRKS
jgi:hypothetical protein